jgi:16S rRNA (uracil1498-N3)-methyltransferase
VEPDHLASLATFFAADESLAEGAIVTLGEEVAHHVRVRRLGVGSAVRLLDGAGRRATASIIRLARGAVAVQLGAVEHDPALPPIHLLVPIADRDRMLWLAEKSTELGLSSWRPVLWRRSRSVKPRGDGPTFATRVRARMSSALEQSGGSWLPATFPDATPERALAAVPDGTRLLLDVSGIPILKAVVQAPVTIAVGPEGGLEPAERELLVSSGFQPVALAGNLMRFETAAIAGLALARNALVAHVGITNGAV